MTLNELRPVLGVAFDVLGAVAGWAVGGGAIGFTLALVALVVAWRRRWLVRGPRVWNVLVALVYPYVLLTLVVGGAAFGTVYGAHQATTAWLERELARTVRTELPTVKEWLERRVEWGDGRPQTMEDAAHHVLSALYVKPASDSWRDRATARAINYVTLNFGKWVITAALAALMGYAMGRAGDTLGLDKQTTQFSIDVIRELDLSRVDDTLPELIDRAVRGKVHTVFHAFELKVVLLVLGLLLVPTVEALLYFLWYRRRVFPSPTM